MVTLVCCAELHSESNGWAWCLLSRKGPLHFLQGLEDPALISNPKGL